MKRTGLGIVLILSLVLALGSCNKKIAAGMAGMGVTLTQEDEAQYNYLFSEALRLKLIGNQADALEFFEKCKELNGQKAEPWYNIAQIAIQGGQTEEALRHAQKAVELAPDNLWYVRFAGGVSFQAGRIDQAIGYFERAIVLDPLNTDLKLTLSNLYTEAGKRDKAEKVLEDIISEKGFNEQASSELARLKVMRKDYKGAEEIVRELIIMLPDNIEYHTLLAEIFTVSGNRNEAMEVYNKLIEENRDNGEIQISLLQFLVEEKADDEIINLLNAIVLNESIPVAAKNEILLRIMDFEEIMSAKSRDLELIIMINEAGVENPDLQTSVVRGEFFIKSGRTGEAIARFEELITLYGMNQYLVERVLMLYYEDGNMTQLYERGKVMAPKVNRSVLAKMLLSLAASEKEDYELAISEARKATILAEGNKELMVQLISIEADALYKSGKRTESFQTFEKALSINPEEIIILNNYAYFLAENDVELDKAYKMAKQVIKREPESNTYLDTYAWVLYKQGKSRQAEKVMARIIASDGEIVADHYEHYGYILKARKKCGEAILYWGKALEKQPDKEILRKEIEDCTK